MHLKDDILRGAYFYEKAFIKVKKGTATNAVPFHIVNKKDIGLKFTKYIIIL